MSWDTLDLLPAAPVTMNPDETVKWSSFELSHGNLYLAPDAPIDVVHTTLALARGDWQAVRGSAVPLGFGSYGTAMRIGRTVYKRTHPEAQISRLLCSPEERGNVIGLNAVRAAVTMHEGLRRLQEAEPPQPGDITYSAPAMLACFVRDGTEIPTANTTWAMASESGVRQRLYHRGEPSYREMHQHFNRAIEFCGALPGSIDFDIKPNNSLVRTRFLRITHVVKLDVQARGHGL